MYSSSALFLFGKRKGAAQTKNNPGYVFPNCNCYHHQAGRYLISQIPRLPLLGPAPSSSFLSFFFSILHARLSGFGDFIRRLFSSKNPRTLFLDPKRKFSRKVQLANVPGQYFFGGGIMLFCALFMHIMLLGIHYGDSFESLTFFCLRPVRKSLFWVEGGHRLHFQIRGERDTHEIPKRHHRDFFKKNNSRFLARYSFCETALGQKNLASNCHRCCCCSRNAHSQWACFDAEKG